MGFLDRAIKKGIGNAISSAVSDAVGGALKNVVGGNSGDSAPAPVQSRPVQADNSQPKLNIRTAMPYILSQEFGAYTVSQGVSAASLGANLSPCKPYDFCLYSGGRVVAAIMLTDHNRDNNTAFRNAKAACAQIGIPFINFYTHMPNQRPYIVERIKGFIR